jgi:hypothetical protein
VIGGGGRSEILVGVDERVGNRSDGRVRESRGDGGNSVGKIQESVNPTWCRGHQKRRGAVKAFPESKI